MNAVSRRCLILAAVVASVAPLTGCSKDVSDEEAARLVALGLEPAIDRAVGLGLAGFNEATSANIPEQWARGDLFGTMWVRGQVDQGSSENKGLRLEVTLDSYADGLIEGEEILYQTGEPLLLDVSLKGLPTGDMDGAFDGRVNLAGSFGGGVDLELDVTARTEPIPLRVDTIQRVPGTTHIFGIARSDFGEYLIDVTR
jgi:hypothetical protein